MSVTLDSLAIFIKYLWDGRLIYDWTSVCCCSSTDFNSWTLCDSLPFRLSSWWEEAICPQTSVNSTRTVPKPWKGWWQTASRSPRTRGRSFHRWATLMLDSQAELRVFSSAHLHLNLLFREFLDLVLHWASAACPPEDKPQCLRTVPAQSLTHWGYQCLYSDLHQTACFLADQTTALPLLLLLLSLHLPSSSKYTNQSKHSPKILSIKMLM